MIPKGRGKYLMALAGVGVMVAIGIMNTRNQIESLQEGELQYHMPSSGDDEDYRNGRNQPRERSGRRNYEPPQRQTEQEVTVRLIGCAPPPAPSKYEGAWLCKRTGGDPGTARFTVWAVRPSHPADGATLSGPAEFTCPAGGFAQEGSRRTCTAKGRTFRLEPVY